MKQLILIVILLVVGFIAYQFFFSASQPDTVTDENASTDGELPPLPRNCESLAGNLENAIYGSASGRVSFAQRNLAYRKFQACLEDAGFSEAEIDDTVAEIEERVKGYLKQDGG